MRVFYPFASSYRCKTLASTFRSMELAKKRKYNKVVMKMIEENEENVKNIKLLPVYYFHVMVE